MHVSHFGNFGSGMDTPSPRSIGIIELGGNLEIIYSAQSVTGKIFRNKESAADSSTHARIHDRVSSLWTSRNGVTDHGSEWKGVRFGFKVDSSGGGADLIWRSGER